MARTRLRGLEIAGIQIGIEVPETCEWDWPDGPIADFSCLPRDPEVHVGLRVGRLASGDLGGERYRLGAWTFEVARRGEDWLTRSRAAGRREQLAHFDGSSARARSSVSSERGAARRYPASIASRRMDRPSSDRRSRRSLSERGGRGRRRAGERPARRGPTSDDPIGCVGSAVDGAARSSYAVLIREEDGQLRSFRTPWSDSIDPALGLEATMSRARVVEEAEQTLSRTTRSAMRPRRCS